MEKKLYSLKLHEEIRTTTVAQDNSHIIYRILRVPGGWIYRSETALGDSIALTSVFVPYNEDFHPMHKPKPLT